MYEGYNTTDEKNSDAMMCPYSQAISDDEDFDRFCLGGDCMAFVRELSSDGTPTGRGRCGMVQPIREMSERDRERMARER